MGHANMALFNEMSHPVSGAHNTPCLLSVSQFNVYIDKKIQLYRQGNRTGISVLLPIV